MTRSRRAVFCNYDSWSYQRSTRAKQPYHEDKSPQRTFHGFVLLRAGPLGAETLSAKNYKVHVKRTMNPPAPPDLRAISINIFVGKVCLCFSATYGKLVGKNSPAC
jgi:hypothetical protein